MHFHDQINEPVQPYGEGEIDISEQQPLDEEETDIVHDLHEAPVSATLIQGNAIVDRDNIVSGAFDGNGITGMVNNPFGDHQKTRLRKMQGSGRRSREYEINANFNEFDQDMDRYSMQNRHVIDEQIQEETFDGNDDTPQDAAAFERGTADVMAGGITVTKKFTVNMEASYRDVSKHIGDVNRDFKENMIRKVHTMKLNDKDGLNKKVEEVKSQEGRELDHLNKTFMELDLKCKKLDRKNDRYEEIIGRLIDQWAKTRRQKKLLKGLK